MRFASLTLIIMLFLVAGCGTPTPAATPTPAPTATPAATATPLPGEVLLVTNGVTDPALLASAQETLTRLATGSGYTLKMLPTATPADLGAQVVVAVFLAPPTDLPALLSSAPQTQFVVVSPTEPALSREPERGAGKSRATNFPGWLHGHPAFQRLARGRAAARWNAGKRPPAAILRQRRSIFLRHLLATLSRLI